MWGRVVAEAKTFLGISCVLPLFFFLKERQRQESPKILFLLEEGMGREGNLGADPLPVFKEERADLGCVNYADRGTHEGALPRGLTELKTGGSLLFQSPSEA